MSQSAPHLIPPASPRVRHFVAGVGIGLMPVAVMLLVTSGAALAPALGHPLAQFGVPLAIGAALLMLLAVPLLLIVHGRRVCGLGLGTGVLLSVVGLGALLLLPYQREAQAMTNLIARALPTGAPVARVRAFLHSRDLRRFAATHYLIETSDDQWPTQRVARYDPGIVGLQDYPGGATLFVDMTSVPYGKLMALQFTFDAHGRLTRHSVDEGWAGI